MDRCNKLVVQAVVQPSLEFIEFAAVNPKIWVSVGGTGETDIDENAYLAVVDIEYSNYERGTIWDKVAPNMSLVFTDMPYKKDITGGTLTIVPPIGTIDDSRISKPELISKPLTKPVIPTESFSPSSPRNSRKIKHRACQKSDKKPGLDATGLGGVAVLLVLAMVAGVYLA